MSVHAEELGHQHVAHQFEDIDQQNESYVVGMWTFLVTEIMFFGALFLALTVYRSAYAAEFTQAHEALDKIIGTINTTVLLFSSLTMALAVRAHMLGARRQVLAFLGVTMLCAFVFLGVKVKEYHDKYVDHLIPGPTFDFPYFERLEAAKKGHPMPEPASSAEAGGSSLAAAYGATGAATRQYIPQKLKEDTHQLFFCLYFAMTGLHAFHIIIGILIMGTIWVMLVFRHPAVNDYMPVEMTGLYWHFVDIVWIFLFPLLYLIGQVKA